MLTIYRGVTDVLLLLFVFFLTVTVLLGVNKSWLHCYMEATVLKNVHSDPRPPFYFNFRAKIFRSVTFLFLFQFWRKHINKFIIKFRYNTCPDWLKQRALSEYRCTESRCHAISPFVKCLEFSLFFSCFFVLFCFLLRCLIKPRKRKQSLGFNGYRPSGT